MKNGAFLILFFSTSLLAKPVYFNELQGQIKKISPSTQAAMKCAVCHGTTNGAKINSFGSDYVKAFKSGGNTELSKDQKWQLLLDQDSNKNGVSNLNDIVNGVNPGI